jgi:hypothetical protein
MAKSPSAKPAAPAPIPEGSPWIVGEPYFIRTVTMHLVGRLVAVYDQELLLEDASWVADSGRWHDALITGKLNEVEPFPAAVVVGRGSIVDATVWSHALPTSQK